MSPLAPALGLLCLQLFLLLRDSERAEYLPDALAARLAAPAGVRLSEKLLLETTFRAVVQQAASLRDETDIFGELAERAASVPDGTGSGGAGWHGSRRHVSMTLIRPRRAGSS